MFRFYIYNLLFLVFSIAVLCKLALMYPEFWTTWLLLGAWSVLLRRKQFRFQVTSMSILMLWRLDFGSRLNRFAGPWFAEEAALFGLIASVASIGWGQLKLKRKA